MSYEIKKIEFEGLGITIYRNGKPKVFVGNLDGEDLTSIIVGETHKVIYVFDKEGKLVRERKAL